MAPLGERAHPRAHAPPPSCQRGLGGGKAAAIWRRLGLGTAPTHVALEEENAKTDSDENAKTDTESTRSANMEPEGDRDVSAELESDEGSPDVEALTVLLRGETRHRCGIARAREGKLRREPVSRRRLQGKSPMEGDAPNSKLSASQTQQRGGSPPRPHLSELQRAIAGEAAAARLLRRLGKAQAQEAGPPAAPKPRPCAARWLEAGRRHQAALRALAGGAPSQPEAPVVSADRVSPELVAAGARPEFRHAECPATCEASQKPVPLPAAACSGRRYAHTHPCGASAWPASESAAGTAAAEAAGAAADAQRGRGAPGSAVATSERGSAASPPTAAPPVPAQAAAHAQRQIPPPPCVLPPQFPSSGQGAPPPVHWCVLATNPASKARSEECLGPALSPLQVAGACAAQQLGLLATPATLSLEHLTTFPSLQAEVVLGGLSGGGPLLPGLLGAPLVPKCPPPEALAPTKEATLPVSTAAGHLAASAFLRQAANPVLRQVSTASSLETPPPPARGAQWTEETPSTADEAPLGDTPLRKLAVPACRWKLAELLEQCRQATPGQGRSFPRIDEPLQQLAAGPEGFVEV